MGSRATIDTERLYVPFGNPNAKRPVLSIVRYSPTLETIKRPAKRAKARLWCHLCGRHHHLQWGEMQNAVKAGASSLEEVVARYTWKYCHVPRYDSYAHHSAEQERPLDKAERFALEIESMHEGVHVDECVHRHKNVYAMKIETPRGVYLNEATAQEWRDLVRNDIRLALQPPKCPFCDEGVDMKCIPVRCEGCKATGYYSVESMMNEILAGLRSCAAWRLLTEFDGLFFVKEMPNGDTVLWVRSFVQEVVSSIRLETPGRPQGPWRGSEPLIQDMPLLMNIEESSSEDIATVRVAREQKNLDLPRFLHEQDMAPPVLRFPDCSMCRHVFRVDDGKRSELLFCVFPEESNAVAKLIGSPSEYIEDWMYEDDERDYRFPDTRIRNLLWNHLLDVALAQFFDVTRQRRSLEGFDPWTGRVVSPVCPCFSLNREHIDLDSLYEEAPVSLPLVFGKKRPEGISGYHADE